MLNPVDRVVEGDHPLVALCPTLADRPLCDDGGRGIESIDVALVCRDTGRTLPLAPEKSPLEELEAESVAVEVVTRAQSRVLLLWG